MSKNNFNKSILCITVFALAFLWSGCAKPPDENLYKASDSLQNYEQQTFENYVNDAKEWLEKNRAFLTTNKSAEIKANTPFEMQPKMTTTLKKGALLVHGLGDSPFYLKDIATTLSNQGFLVRTILLPGHGTRPADLKLPEFYDWEMIVKHHVQLLSSQVDELWLGGFSTGANLVSSYAFNHENIKGLLLFSPAFTPRDDLHVLAPFVSHFIDWLDIDPHEQNYTRYSTIAMNGVSLYSKSVTKVENLLDEKSYDKPVLIVISESDSVIDSKKTVQLFQKKFVHPKSKLIWYGKEKIQQDSRIISLSSSLPKEKISTFSHMSVLFHPDNPYYGKNGSQLICDNGQSQEAEKQCPTSKNLWYSSYDYVEDGKIHARLTWNPYFKDLENTIKMVTQ